MYPISLEIFLHTSALISPTLGGCLWQQANLVIAATSGLAVFLALVPLRFVLMGLTAFFFLAGSRGGHRNGPRNRRLREWWDSIPIVPVRILREVPPSA